MFAGDGQPGFGQQEMHVGHAAVQRVLDRNDRAIRVSRAHRVDRVGEVETWQRQAIGKCLPRGDMAVGTGSTLERDRPVRFGGGGFGHPRHDRARGGGKIFHELIAIRCAACRLQPALIREARFTFWGE